MNWRQNLFVKTLITVLILFLSISSSARDDAPVFLQSFIDFEEGAKSVDWEAPDYGNQKGRIGYHDKAFAVPEGMRERVDFWKDIYAKYTSNQGLLHDSRLINLVYSVVELPSEKSTGLEKAKVQKLRKKAVKDAKKVVEDRLHRLQKHLDAKKSLSELSGEDLRVWVAFSDDKHPRKFARAAKKNRLRLQLGQKDHFAKGIFYSGRYVKEIEKIFAEYNLPKELTRLPFVESSFNILAESKVGASGIWQFMRYTARAYMKMNRYVDERNHPLKATRAAAKMFRWIYKKTGSWPLAVTGYNYGPTGIYRLAKRYKTQNLAELIERVEYARFGFASQNFYASFLAALEVEKNAAKYFNEPKLSPELVVDRVKLAKPILWKNLVQLFDGDHVTARVYNPHFSSRVRRGYYSIPRRYHIYVPQGMKKRALASIKRLPAKARVAVHKVRRGETLSHIADKFGVSLRELAKVNRIRYVNRLHVGQTLKIPD